MVETWTPAAYLKVMDDDVVEAERLFYEMQAAHDDEALEYLTSEYIRYLGKLTDNAKLLKGSLIAARTKA